jgi:hypothetical protein
MRVGVHDAAGELFKLLGFLLKGGTETAVLFAQKLRLVGQSLEEGGKGEIYIYIYVNFDF